jgi:hypothetical protein
MAKITETDLLPPVNENDNEPMLKAILGGIWEGFKTLVAWLVIIYATVFFVIGGEFKYSINIKWENVSKFWHAIVN